MFHEPDPFPADAERKTILMVEDEAILALSEEQRLRSEGYNVLCAQSGEEAIEIAAAHPAGIDLILMDINLGSGIDGTVAAQKILAFRNLPILFLSAHTDKETVEKTEKITSYGYVVKNSSPTVLFASIKMALKLFEANRKIQETEADYRDLFDTSLNAIALHEIILDPDGRPIDYVFLRVNSAFERHTGLRACEVLNQPATAVFPGIEQSGLIQIYGKVALTGESISFEHFFESDHNFYSITAFQAGRRRFAVVFENITERKRSENELQESAERLRRIIQNSNAGYFRINNQGEFMEVNGAWLAMHGYTCADEIVGKHFSTTQIREDQEKALAIVQHVLGGNSIPSAEFTRRRKDNSTGYHRFSITPVLQNGSITGLEGFLIDTTQSRQAEEALRQNEERYHALFERAPLGYQSLDSDGNFLEINQTWLDILGYTREEVIGRWFGDFLAPEVVDAFRTRFPQFKADGKIHSEFEMLHKDGGRRHIAFEGRIGYKEDGTFLQTHCILADISERIRQSQSLKASENRFQTIFNASPNAILVADDGGKYLAANPAAVAMFGYPLEQLLQMHVSDLQTSIPPDAGERYRQYLQKGKEEGRFDFIRADGAPRTAQYSAARVETNFNLSILNDITLRNQQEDELRRNKKILQAIIDTSPTHLVYLDPEFNFVAVNATYAQTCKRSPDELIGKNHFEFYPHAENEAIFKQVRETGQPVTFHDKPFEFPDQPERGTTYWDWTLTPVQDDSGTLEGMTYSLVETTERVRSEEKLRMYERIVSSTPDGISFVDKNYCHQMVNDAYEIFSGVKPEAFLGKTVSEYLGEEVFQECIKPHFDRCLEGETIQQRQWVQFPNMGSKFIHVTYFPYRNAKNKIVGIVANTRDMTEQKIAEEKIVRLLEEKELLLREVHHRVKNNMATITSLLELQIQTLQEAPAKNALQDAAGRIQSMNVLYDLLNRSENINSVALKDYTPHLLEEIVEIFPNAASVQIKTRIDDIALQVNRLYPLGIILNELITNAMKYAFQGRSHGTITLTAEQQPDCIAITFADDGIGLPEHISFQNPPGLGMLLVDKLIQQLDATITIQRDNGTGYLIQMPV